MDLTAAALALTALTGCGARSSLDPFAAGPGVDGGGGGSGGGVPFDACAVREGLQAGAPWPMGGRCAARQSRAAVAGPSSGDIQWTLPLPDVHLDVRAAPVIAADGTLYVGCDGYSVDGSLFFAISPAGGIKWSFGPQYAISTSPAVGADGTVYFASEDYHLYALTAEGGLKWVVDIDGPSRGAPAIGADGTIYIAAGNISDILYAVSPEGVLKWTTNVGESHFLSPALGRDGTIYTTGDNLRAISPDGALLWVVATPALVSSAPVVADDGTIYYSDVAGLHAVRPDGTVKWTSPLQGEPSLAPDGTLHVVSEDPLSFTVTLSALDPEGNVKWTQADALDRPQTMVDAEGTIHGSFGGELRAFGKDGSLKWSASLGNKVIKSAPVMNQQGTVYVGGPGFLAAIGP